MRDRWHVRAGEWCAYAGVRALRAMTGWIPVHPLAAALAPLGGWGALAIPSYRRRAEANIAHVWPELAPAARRRLARAAGASALGLGIEYLHLERWARSVDLQVEGGEHLDRSRAEGRGALLVTAHYGNWEAIRLAVTRTGGNCAILYRAFNNRYLDRFAQRHIARMGTPVLQKGRRGLKTLHAHLAAGGTALILVDQRNSGAPILPFLGHGAETSTAPAALARATGAALIPAVARREAHGRKARVTFEVQIPADDPVAAMTAVNTAISTWIEAAPEQWFWFHRRWRRTRRSRDAGNHAD